MTTSNPLDGRRIQGFLSYEVMLLLVSPSPFESGTVTVIIRSIASAVGKLYQLWTEKLGELRAPWLKI